MLRTLILIAVLIFAAWAYEAFERGEEEPDDAAPQARPRPRRAFDALYWLRMQRKVTT